MLNPSFIAVDWGTSNFRAYLLDNQQTVLDQCAHPLGVLSVKDFKTCFKELLGDWLSHSIPVLMSGMVGSSKGWVEVPYQPCPASLGDLASGLYEVQPGVFIVPGVRLDLGNRVDVMRGEEVQVLGAGQDGLFCLPGTHSKWVTVKDKTISDFSTYMSGELFNVISTQTILKTDKSTQEDADQAFIWGLEKAQEACALSALLFTARSFVLAEKLNPKHVDSYLSGLLIGSELKHALNGSEEVVHLIADEVLALWYQKALNHLGKKVRVLDAEQVTIHGLYSLLGEAHL